jgi:hypothetical protein
VISEIKQNKYSKTSKRHKSAFTLIEALVFLFIFSLAVVTFYSAFALGTSYISESKKMISASALANEKMEIIRNLDYADIGVEGGIPSGNVPGREIVVKSGITYYVFTTVRYHDDALDGKEDGTPDDIVPTDYKKVRIKVAWEDDVDSNKSSVAFSDFAPPKKETPLSGGTLAINVLDKDGSGIPQVTVHISNPGKSINFTDVTDSTGSLSYPGAPADGQNYSIEISRNGYYPIHTYIPYPNPPYNFDPVDEHVAITEGRLNVTAIITDLISNFTIITEDPFGTDIPNLAFDLSGGRKIGDTVPGVVAVYDYEESLNSGADASVDFEDMSYGPYFFTPDSGITGYEFMKLDNATSTSGEFTVEPDQDFEIKAIFADENINSLLVTVLNSADSTPIEGAEVNLKNVLLTYDATVTSDKFGKAYFPKTLPELELETYELNVTATGFQNETENVDINKLTQQTISLDAT